MKATRLAGFQDIPAIVAMAETFLDAQPLPLPFSPIWARDVASRLISEKHGFAVVLEAENEIVGMLLAAASESPLAPVLVSQEIAFWIEPEARGDVRLARQAVEAYRDWARGLDVQVIGLSSFVGGNCDAAFRRWGFEPLETHFIARN